MHPPLSFNTHTHIYTFFSLSFLLQHIFIKTKERALISFSPQITSDLICFTGYFSYWFEMSHWSIEVLKIYLSVFFHILLCSIDLPISNQNLIVLITVAICILIAIHFFLIFKANSLFLFFQMCFGIILLNSTRPQRPLVVFSVIMSHSSINTSWS